MRRAGPDRPELDAPSLQLLLDLVGEELLTAVGLDALHGERHFLEHLLEEGQAVGGGAARVEAEDLEARAVVDRGVLVEAGADLADVDLHPVAGYRAAVALGALAAEWASLQPALAVADEDLVDGVERQLERVLADELDAQPLDPELALAAERQDERFLGRSDLAVR
jgi:hypothetical protein